MSQKKVLARKLLPFSFLDINTTARKYIVIILISYFSTKKPVGVQSWRAAHLPTLEIRYIKKVILHALSAYKITFVDCNSLATSLKIHDCNHDIKLDLNGVVTGKTYFTAYIFILSSCIFLLEYFWSRWMNEV